MLAHNNNNALVRTAMDKKKRGITFRWYGREAVRLKYPNISIACSNSSSHSMQN